MKQLKQLNFFKAFIHVESLKNIVLQKKLIPLASHILNCVQKFEYYGEGGKNFIFSNNPKYGRETFSHGRSYVYITLKR